MFLVPDFRRDDVWILPMNIGTGMTVLELALTLSHKLSAFEILTDDLELRKAAESLGLETHGPLGIILRAYKKDRLSLSETKGSLRSFFAISSLYLSPKLVNRVIDELSKEKKA